MKTFQAGAFVFAAGLLLGHSNVALAQQGRASVEREEGIRRGGRETPPYTGEPRVRYVTREGVETEKDLPGDRTKYFGERRDLVGTARKIAKVDLDADFGGDGIAGADGHIDNHDPADNGAVQQTPPGLIVGIGDLVKCVLRVKPYRFDYYGDAFIRLEVDGINRRDKSGQYGSLDEELQSSGWIKVWTDRDRKVLVLDSRNPDMRHYDWTIEPGRLHSVPAVLFVEGTKASDFSGDVRLIFSAQSRSGAIKAFGSQYDHIVMTIEPKSLPDRHNASTYWAQGRHAAFLRN